MHEIRKNAIKYEKNRSSCIFTTIYLVCMSKQQGAQRRSVTNSAVTLRCFDIHVKTAECAATKRYKRYKRYTF